MKIGIFQGLADLNKNTAQKRPNTNGRMVEWGKIVHLLMILPAGK